MVNPNVQLQVWCLLVSSTSYSGISALNSFVASKYGSVDMENEYLNMGCMKKMTTSMIENKRTGKVQQADTCWNPKRHMSQVSLLL